MEAFHLAKEIRRFIRQDMNEIADHMATGSCADWADYKRLSGIVEGLARVERHLGDLTDDKVFENEDQ